MTSRCYKSLVALAIWLCGAAVSQAQPDVTDIWPGWRGGTKNGVGHASRLPSTWSRSQNVVWSVDLAGEGSSSPVVWGQRLFLTSSTDDGLLRHVQCFSIQDGRLLWDRSLEDDDPELTSALTGYAAATPVTDGRRVIAFFGNAGVVCFDLEGRRQWQVDLGQFDTELGMAASPVLHDGKVILLCDHDGSRFRTFDSFLCALDANNGEMLWKRERPDLFRSWSTPVLVDTKGGVQELIVNAQDELRAYAPDTGKPLWKVTGMTGWVTPTPVVGNGLVFACSGRKGPVLAVQPGGKGDVTAARVRWRQPNAGPYVPSPLFLEGRLYLIEDEGFLSCLAANSGKRFYRRRLTGRFRASPVAADGKIFLLNEEGTTFVVKSGVDYKLLAECPLEEECLASPAIAHESIFLRTLTRLYRIAERP